ncbi:MAG: cytochrome c family protein [Alphaproteobacteria bacterium]|nr:cytochrome c family protein [Alphaproteobacteria bacterium]
MKSIFILLSLSLMAAVSLVNTSFAEGNAANGQKVFKRCGICHSSTKGARNRIGPNLFGVYGRKSAQVAGYRYSKAMKAADLTWDDATLNTWLTKPRGLVKRTKMTFAGLRRANQRADVIAYLKTLK